MNSLPRIIDPNDDLLCEDCVGGQRLLHRVPRSPIVRPITNEGNGDALLDEAGIPIRDEATNNLIFDTYPHVLIS